MSTQKTASLIDDYRLEMVEPGCHPGTGNFGVRVSFTADISPVFPFLNAVWKNGWYDKENHIFIWGDTRQRYAFRSHEIRIGRVEDPQDGSRTAAGIVEKVNGVWIDRANITPRYTEKSIPAVIELYTLLPKNNCKDCGRVTCLVFASDLREGKATVDDCSFLCSPEQEEIRQKVLDLFIAD